MATGTIKANPTITGIADTSYATGMRTELVNQLIKKDDIVFVEIFVEYTNTIGMVDIWRLPEGFRPSQTVRLPAFFQANDKLYAYYVELKSSGLISQGFSSSAKQVQVIGAFKTT